MRQNTCPMKPRAQQNKLLSSWKHEWGQYSNKLQQLVSVTSVAGRDDATVVNTILPKLFFSPTRFTGSKFQTQTRFCSIFNEIWGSCLYVIICCFYLHFKRLHEEALQNARRQKINLKLQKAVQTASSDLFALRSCILKCLLWHKWGLKCFPCSTRLSDWTKDESYSH